MAHRIPLDRLKTLARSGLEIGKVAGARATRTAAAGVTKALETAEALRGMSGQDAQRGPADAAGATFPKAEPTPARTETPASAPPAEERSAEVPTPTDVAKVVERKPAAEKAAARKAPPTKTARKPAKKSAPGAKLPPRKQADA